MQKIISIQTKQNGLKLALICFTPEKVSIDENTKLLTVKMKNVYTLVFAKDILHMVRAIHCCTFSRNFYYSVFGTNISEISETLVDLANCCASDYENFCIKHNYQNPYFFISQYVNANFPLLYHWLPIMYSETIKKSNV